MEITNSVLFTLLILILLLISWLLGYFSRLRNWPARKSSPDSDYFVGLNYLLNDEPDDAIDVFIEALEINTATFDTHLALGKLLRRRGKVDRSIAHYEFLIEAQTFNSRQINQIKIQLVRSFIAAGLLDRAEELLKDLQTAKSSVSTEALSLAMMVYQIEKEWQQALEAATELLKLTPAQHRHDLLMQISHFYCELAELALQNQQPDIAASELKQAMKLFKGNIRVYMLSARADYMQGRQTEAVNTLVRALQHEPAFFYTIYPLILEYMPVDKQQNISGILVDIDPELATDSYYLAELSREKLRAEGHQAAIAFLQQKIRTLPSLTLLGEAIQLAANQQSDEQGMLKDCATVLDNFLSGKAHYRCESCGFELKSLHWCCPGCSGWGLVRPVSNPLSVKSD